jgi:two-component system, NtrC family, response regulator GlrR
MEDNSIGPELCGRSPAHRKLLDQLDTVAATDAEVLLTGPTGVGKEMYAKYVHKKSRRANRPFVAVNCGALPNELLENELFGHVTGAYTDARTHSRGLVAEAEGGTLLLDEIDTFSQINQVKLLRFLQEKEYRPLGETRVKKANIRIIAASNANLENAAREGKFRQDLFFRLRVAYFEISPLCKRPEDIRPLLSVYTDFYAERYKLPPIDFAESALHTLEAYAWPGNVRELVNCVQRLTLKKLFRPVEPGDLDLLDWDQSIPAAEEMLPFQEAKRIVVQQFEQSYLETTLRDSNGNISRAAHISGKDRRAYFELMRKNGVNAKNYGATHQWSRNLKSSGG